MNSDIPNSHHSYLTFHFSTDNWTVNFSSHVKRKGQFDICLKWPSACKAEPGWLASAAACGHDL